MTRYTLSIVTQLKTKMQRFMHASAGILFGQQADYSKYIADQYRDHGIFLYQPFGGNKESTISLFPYNDPLIRASIWQFKFKNNTKYIPLYCHCLAQVLIELLSELEYTHDFNSPLLCIIPSHSRTRRMRRGCSNTRLGQALASREELTLEYQPRIIKKVRYITQQSKIKNSAKRKINVRNSFVVLKPSQVKDRNIILLDDVYTTGATLREVSKILRKHGARRILRVTLAH